MEVDFYIGIFQRSYKLYFSGTEEREESVYNNYISEIRNFRMHLEAHEEHLIRQIRTPLERDDLEQSLQRIKEHEVHIWVSIIVYHL